MAQIVGTIPDFTSDDAAPGVVQEEVVTTTEAPAEEAVVEEKETPEPPAEKPAGTAASAETTAPPQVQDDKSQREIAALQEERVKLLKDIAELRGQRREIKQDELAKLDKHVDELKDLHPEDVSTIDRVLRSKGYMTKEETTQMFYNAVKDDALTLFLNKYPEYKPENDPNDLNWGMLQKELSYFKMPSDPHQVSQVLERAHRGIVKVPTSPSVQVQKRQVAVASAGAGGIQKSPVSTKSLTSEQREMYRRGGWSDDEISNIEKRLPD